jgi:hypothetical protein
MTCIAQLTRPHGGDPSNKRTELLLTLNHPPTSWLCYRSSIMAESELTATRNVEIIRTVE